MSSDPSVDHVRTTLGPWRLLAERVWTAVAEPASVTIGLVAGAREALVIDCGSTPAQGAEIRRSAEEVSGVPVTSVLVTHAHHDHWFGLAGFDGIASLGHDSLLARLDEAGTATQARRWGLRPGDLRAPSAPIGIVTARDVGGRRLEVFHGGAGHTEGDLVAHLPDADLLFVGDLVEQAGPPWYGQDSDPLAWAATLDSVIGLMGPRTRVVVGHGEPVDRDFCLRARAATAAVAGEIRALVERGVPLAEAMARGQWPWPAEHLAAGVARGYALLGGPRPPQPPRITLPMA